MHQDCLLGDKIISAVRKIGMHSFVLSHLKKTEPHRLHFKGYGETIDDLEMRADEFPVVEEDSRPSERHHHHHHHHLHHQL